MTLTPVPRQFYLRPTLTVARELPGFFLCRRWRGSTLVGRIVEVEAYLGSRDPASHAFNGETPRNRVMFGEGGHLYVYFTYGMHYCANVVTGAAGVGEAVLIRAVEPIGGMDVMVRNRTRFGWSPAQGPLRNLCNGPAKLCQSMGIGRRDNGVDLCGERIWLSKGTGRTERLRRSARIGIRRGTEHLWRFYLEGNPHVSRGASNLRGSR